MYIELYAVHSKRIWFLGYKISIFKRWFVEYEEFLEDLWNIKLFLNEYFDIDWCYYGRQIEIIES